MPIPTGIYKTLLELVILGSYSAFLLHDCLYTVPTVEIDPAEILTQLSADLIFDP